MILSVLTGLLFGSDGYYVALAWTSSALMYFIVSLAALPLPLPQAGAGLPRPSSRGWSWGCALPAQLSRGLPPRRALCEQQPWAPTAWGPRPPGSGSSST